MKVVILNTSQKDEPLFTLPEGAPIPRVGEYFQKVDMKSHVGGQNTVFGGRVTEIKHQYMFPDSNHTVYVYVAGMMGEWRP